MIPFAFIASHWWLWLICVSVLTIITFMVFVSGFFSKNVKSFFVRVISVVILVILSTMSWLLFGASIVLQLIQFVKKA
jgi:hypothetical protein